MWTAWWYAVALGFHHGSGCSLDSRPQPELFKSIHCATPASDTQPIRGDQMPARNSTTDKPSFPKDFIPWDMKKVSMMKWWHDMADVLPQLEAGVRTLFFRGTATGDRTKTVVSSNRQIQDLERGLAPTYTFMEPAPLIYVPRTPPTDPAELVVYEALAAVAAPDVTDLVKSRQNLLNSHLGRALFRNKLWNIRCSTVFHSRLWNSLDHSCVPRYVPEMFHNRHVPGRHGTQGNGVNGVPPLRGCSTACGTVCPGG